MGKYHIPSDVIPRKDTITYAVFQSTTPNHKETLKNLKLKTFNKITKLYYGGGGVNAIKEKGRKDLFQIKTD